MKSCIFYLLKKLGNVVIRAYLCCPPLRQAVLVVLKQNLMGGGGWRRGPHFDELLHLYPKSFGQGCS